MAFLVADKVTTVNGVKMNEKIIPLNAKRKNGNYFRDQRKLKPLYVTIHNTGEIVTITKNMIAGLEPEKMAEKPKEEIKGG